MEPRRRSLCVGRCMLGEGPGSTAPGAGCKVGAGPSGSGKLHEKMIHHIMLKHDICHADHLAYEILLFSLLLKYVSGLGNRCRLHFFLLSTF